MLTKLHSLEARRQPPRFKMLSQSRFKSSLRRVSGIYSDKNAESLNVHASNNSARLNRLIFHRFTQTQGQLRSFNIHTASQSASPSMVIPNKVGKTINKTKESKTRQNSPQSMQYDRFTRIPGQPRVSMPSSIPTDAELHTSYAQPEPLYVPPSPEVAALLAEYHTEHEQSVHHQEKFWAREASYLPWRQFPSIIRSPDHNTPIHVKSTTQSTDLTGDTIYNSLWFEDGTLNICEMALDYHVANGRGSQPAFYYESLYTPRNPNANINPHTHRADLQVLSSDVADDALKECVTYDELLLRVKRMATALRSAGVRSGETVLIYMPMIVDTAVTMLACARIGAPHCVVFGGFAVTELTKRLKASGAKIIVTASAGIEPGKVIPYKPLIDAAVSSLENDPQNRSHRVEKVVIVQRDVHLVQQEEMVPNRDIFFDDFLREGDIAAKGGLVHDEPEIVKSTHPLYVLYTSGTTGDPKGVVRDCGGGAVSLHHAMRRVFGMSPGESWWAMSDFGWAVGHSLSVYGPLLLGASSVLLEGKPVGTPDAGQLWRILSDYKVRAMFLSPTALRAVKREDSSLTLLQKFLPMITEGVNDPMDLMISSKTPQRRENFHQGKGLRAMFVAGERVDQDTVEWIYHGLKGKVAIINHWWQTESGFPITGTVIPDSYLHYYPTPIYSIDSPSSTNPLCATLPSPQPKQPIDSFVPDIFKIWEMFPGSTGLPVFGFQVKVLNEQGKEVPAMTVGNIVIQLPLPPGFCTTLWQDHTRFVKSYLSRFPGFYDTSDAGFIDHDGYLYVVGRTDDVMNVAGHRLSTGAIEEALAKHPLVAECCVVGAPDALKGEVPLGFIVLKHTHSYGIESDGELLPDLAVNISTPETSATSAVLPNVKMGRTRKSKASGIEVEKNVDGTTAGMVKPLHGGAILSGPYCPIVRRKGIVTGTTGEMKIALGLAPVEMKVKTEQPPSRRLEDDGEITDIESDEYIYSLTKDQTLDQTLMSSQNLESETVNTTVSSKQTTPQTLRIEDLLRISPVGAAKTSTDLPNADMIESEKLRQKQIKAATKQNEKKIEKELIKLVRDSVGAIATPKRVLVVRALPKNRSGKILRGTLHNILKFVKDKSDGQFPQFSQVVPVPATIEDPAVLEQLRISIERAELY